MNDSGHRPTVFCSYSSADRRAVTGLGLLLEALGNQVFIDHRSLKPGVQWRAGLRRGLDVADHLLVYWTHSASRSDWVRREIEYFHVRYPDRPLIPILADNTPPTDLLLQYQAADFCPLVNELLVLQKELSRLGVKPAEIHDQIAERLQQAGIIIPPQERRKLMYLFPIGGLAGLMAAPWMHLLLAGDQLLAGVLESGRLHWLALGLAVTAGATLFQLFSDSACLPVGSVSQLPARPQATAEAEAEADIWLGMWRVVDSRNSQRQDTIFVERHCDSYRIPVKGAVVQAIDGRHLSFIEGGHRYTASWRGAGSAVLTPEGRGDHRPVDLQLVKIQGYVPVVRPCK
ncbi:toll/interleukin-1 receptor domain-containing protein [Parahaliea mediterranea]|uniref:toll/interleukin-1 receptor domain-containing protein n=1 Tax=Parahaliea mediterranea TaxID=651086 RepID=UPI000E2EE27E|nr:toll/interleukin-1 receptor domain-containing protein [Parahaliea mediterranea]